MKRHLARVSVDAMVLRWEEAEAARGRRPLQEEVQGLGPQLREKRRKRRRKHRKAEELTGGRAICFDRVECVAYSGCLI